MRITIHQPEHMPWLGFFHKMAQADTFVFLDNVQFSKNYFQNRNKLRTTDGWVWLTVPVKRTLETLIQDVTISRDARWKRKWRDTIFYSYKKAKFFDAYFQGIDDVISGDWEKLCDLNEVLIQLFAGFLGIRPTFMKASELEVTGRGSDLIFSICKTLGAKTYLSGISGREYLDLNKFESSGIEVMMQEFHHPVYKQIHEPFIPCMSVIDLLFNYGGKSLDIINGIGVPVLEEVFN